MARYLPQLIILGARIVGRAFTKAFREEFVASQAAARQSSANSGTSGAVVNSKLGMTLQEATQILNIEPSKVIDKELVQKNYDHLFNVNDKSKGGSFYLQSKVVRAKERIDEEMKILEKNSKTKTSDNNFKKN